MTLGAPPLDQPRSPAPIAAVDDHFVQAIAADVARYQTAPSAEEAASRLRAARLAIARAWLPMPAEELRAAYEGAMGDAHRRIVESGLPEALLTTPEAEILERCRGALKAGFGGEAAINHLLAGMMFAGPHALLTQIDLDHTPAWLIEDLFSFTLRTPTMFRARGEVAAFAAFIGCWLAFIDAQTAAEPRSPFWRSVASFVLQRLDVIPLYFAEGAHPAIYRHRAAIIERALEQRGDALDHTFPARDPARTKRRIGVLSSGFTPQPETYATLPAFAHLDRDRYEIVLLAGRSTGDPIERRCADLADRFMVLTGDVRADVAAIRALDLDVIWLGSNMTAVTNGMVLLAAHRLARLQVTSACVPATTGLRNVDVFVSGSSTEPAERAQEHYTERLALVRGISHCFEIPPHAALPAVFRFSRASLGARAGDVIFVSGANFHKIIPELEHAWMRALAEVPGSILVLYPFNPHWSSSYPVTAFVERLRAGASAQGVSPDRVKVLPPMPSGADIEGLLRVCDLYLDSFPHSGVTSLLDPLRVALPTIVLSGGAMRSRMGAAMMRAMEVEELVAPDEDGFVSRCRRLASDPVARRDLSARIAAAMAGTPMFLDGAWYGKEVQRILDDELAERAPGPKAPSP